MRALVPRIPKAAQRELNELRNKQELRRYTDRTGRYSYIPLHFPTAQRMLDVTIKAFQKRRGRDPETFLEVGCGFGVITHYAQTHLKLDATGIDIVRSYVNLSKRYLKGQFLQRDALKYRDYGKFDIIYFYQPFFRHELKNTFCKLLAEQATGLVAPLYALRDTPFDLKQRFVEVYGSGTEQPFKLDRDDPFCPFDGQTKQLVWQNQ